MSNTTLFIHLYYPGSWQLIKRECGAVIRDAYQVIITVCHEDVAQEVDCDKEKKITVLIVTNRGKDIGGKLTAFSYYLEFCEKTTYLILLHDKISPQTINADYWFQRLYSIFKADIFEKAMRKMNEKTRIGVLGAMDFLKNEYIPSQKRFDNTNNDLLFELMESYRIRFRKGNFIAGTIFIARSLIYERFFLSHSALAARENLETGNVLDLTHGTYTHSWERLLCFIAEDQGYVIEGI